MTNAADDTECDGHDEPSRQVDASGRPTTAAAQDAANRGDPPPVRGADLARAALESVRARNAASRRGKGTPHTRSATSSRRLRRRRWSGPGIDKARDPQRLGDTVRSWLTATESGRDVARATLFTRWEQLVGPEIADHATPVSLVDGELVVQAESTAWATQLRLMAGRMTQRINAEIGRGTVARIRTQGPTGPSWRFGHRHVSGRGPRDTYG